MNSAKETKNDLRIIQEHISGIQSKKQVLLSEKKDSISKLTKCYTNNISMIESIISSLEEKEALYSKELQKKHSKQSQLSSNISLIQSQISILKHNNHTTNQQTLQALMEKRNTISTSVTHRTRQYFKYFSYAIKERHIMLQEDLSSTKSSLISLTSKIESHTEFVINLLKSKSILSNSLEKLNEIPLQASLDDINSKVDFKQLGQYLYIYGKDELQITLDKELFINNIQAKSSLIEIIDYVIELTQSKLPQNLFEYLLIAISRIITYESIIDIRLRFINGDCDDNDTNPIETTVSNEQYDHPETKRLRSEIESIDREIDMIEREKEENEKMILQMENDLKMMVDYNEKIRKDIGLKEREILMIQKDAIERIDQLKKENEDLLRKIEQKKVKMIEIDTEMNKEIESMNHFKENVVKTKTEMFEERKNMQCSQKPPEFFYPITMNKNDLILSERIAPLYKGGTLLKRTILNVKKKIYESYSPIIRNKKANPLDYNFKKSFGLVDDKMTKIIFQKLTPLEKNLEISLTSLSRIEVPLITKSLVFIKRIYNKLINKLNLKTKDDIDEFILNNQSKVISLYNKGNQSSNYEIDEKILNKDYRDSLLEANCFLLYIYLKPDEDTKIEVIFDTYDDFKNWLNGLEAIISNAKEVCKIIQHYLI